MAPTVLLRHSVKTRITLTLLAIFLVSLWSLSFYASRMLRHDMERLLGAQQFSTASFIAAEVNDELDDRLRALEEVAATVAPALLGNPAAMQAFVEQRPVLQRLFNAGILAYRLDGTAVADSLVSTGRIGVNFMDRDYIVGALKAGKATIGRPVMGRKLPAPVFAMAVPILDAQGHVIGALAGVINLGAPNFLDQLAASRYGVTGGYRLIAPQYRLVVTASDKSRIMETLPAPGINALIDRFVQGYEGSGVVVGPLGVEMLVSAKNVPLAGWYVAAILSTAEAFAPIRAMQQRMLLATLLLTLLAGILTWWTVRRQLAPMLAAARTLATLSDAGQPPQPLPVTRQDEIGQLIGGFNHLIESLAQREVALKQSAGFTQATLNSVTAEIAVLDRDGVILAVNEPWRRFALDNGREPRKPGPSADVGTNYLAVCQPGKGFATDGTVEACDGIRAVLDGRLPSFSLEYPCHSPQEKRWFSMSVTPLGEAAAGGVVVAHTNISKRRQTEEELRIAAIAFECQEGIVVMDENLRILRVNQAFTHITGYSREEIQGRTPGFARSDRHPASVYDAAWDEARCTGAWQGELWHRRKNGENYLSRTAITAVRDNNGWITHFVGNFTDVTSKHLQEQQRLHHETAHRNLLVREVHHRIKNNLQGITGILSLFAQQYPETAVPIHQAIGQVQSISVIHGLQGRAVISSVRLCELTGAIADEIQNLWQTPVTVGIPPDWLACVISEREAVPIALVINELIVNAVKHGGKARGHVSITLRKGLRPNVVQIEISNAGQLSTPVTQTDAHRNGLQLVSALMPRTGATLAREQRGDQVVTLLELEPPVISLEQKEPT